MRGRILLTFVLLFVMVGCQKKNETQISEEIGMSTHSSDNQESLRWEQEISLKCEGIKGVKIDANMNFPGNLNPNNEEYIVSTKEFPKYTIIAKEAEYTDDYMHKACEWCYSTYEVDFMDSIHADTDKEERWIQEYGEGTGYRRKCIQWVKKDIQYDTCTVSIKEANDEAQKFMSSELENLLEISYTQTGEIKKEKIDVGNGNTVEALCVHFVPTVDDFLLYPEQNEMAFINLEQTIIDDYSPDVSVDVYIVDDGVVCVRYNNPIDIVELKANNGYVSYKEAMDCLVDEIQNNRNAINLNYTVDSYVVLDDFHIQYLRMDAGEYYEYVPCYVLCKKNDWNDKTEYQNFIKIDARK